jgi:hypothetical protein
MVTSVISKTAELVHGAKPSDKDKPSAPEKSGGMNYVGEAKADTPEATQLKLILEVLRTIQSQGGLA